VLLAYALHSLTTLPPRCLLPHLERERGGHDAAVGRGVARRLPDLRFEVHETLAEADTVAGRSTMTGTDEGPVNIGPMAALPVTGARSEVPHMHFFRYDQRGHAWNTLLLARQFGARAARPAHRGLSLSESE
jgi:hypothetical protein